MVGKLTAPPAQGAPLPFVEAPGYLLAGHGGIAGSQRRHVASLEVATGSRRLRVLERCLPQVSGQAEVIDGTGAIAARSGAPRPSRHPRRRLGRDEDPGRITSGDDPPLSQRIDALGRIPQELPKHRVGVLAERVRRGGAERRGSIRPDRRPQGA